MNDDEDENEIIDWQLHHEIILIDWGDRANCYKWLHNKSHHKYTRKKNIFTIPVIIMSTLTGTGNFALERFPEEYRSYITIFIGSINILAGIITTISQFLKLNELSESHRMSTLSWDKFYRNIKSELLKAPKERIHVNFFIKNCKDEFDRLMETSPNIDLDIQDLFIKNLTKGKDKSDIERKKKLFNELNKPDIFDEIPTIKNKVYSLNFELQNKEEEQETLNNFFNLKKELEKKRDTINNFKTKFEEKQNRQATLQEIIRNNSEIPKEEIIILCNNNN